MKKLLLSLGSLTTIIAPVAAVVSCGPSNDNASSSFSVKKLKATSDGFVIALPQNGPKLFISAEDAAKTGGSLTVKTPAGDKVVSWTNAITTASQKIKVGEQEVDVTPTAVAANSYVLEGVNYFANLSDLNAAMPISLISVNGNGKFAFDFTDASKETNTPVITDDSRKAFEALLAEAELVINGDITFSSRESNGVKTITPRFTVVAKFDFTADLAKVVDATSTKDLATLGTDIATKTKGTTVLATALGITAPTLSSSTTVVFTLTEDWDGTGAIKVTATVTHSGQNVTKDITITPHA